MLNGSISFDDIILYFWSNADSNKTKVRIYNMFTGKSEQYETDSSDFSKALSIAVHWEGMPDSKKDYPAAERAQGTIRWIP